MSMPFWRTQDRPRFFRLERKEGLRGRFWDASRIHVNCTTSGFMGILHLNSENSLSRHWNDARGFCIVFYITRSGIVVVLELLRWLRTSIFWSNSTQRD